MNNCFTAGSQRHFVKTTTERNKERLRYGMVSIQIQAKHIQEFKYWSQRLLKTRPTTILKQTLKLLIFYWDTKASISRTILPPAIRWPPTRIHGVTTYNTAKWKFKCTFPLSLKKSTGTQLTYTNPKYLQQSKPRRTQSMFDAQGSGHRINGVRY